MPCGETTFKDQILTVGGYLADYQSIDTCTLEEYRGLGLFRKITLHELEILGDDCCIYGFPNPNSYPGYKKFGWNVHGEFRDRLFTSISEFEKESPLRMEYDYAKWRFQSRKDFYHTKHADKYLLVSQKSVKHFLSVVSIVDERTALLFPKYKGLKILVYSSKKRLFYNRHRPFMPLVSTGAFCENIPHWKLDTL